MNSWNYLFIHRKSCPCEPALCASIQCTLHISHILNLKWHIKEFFHSSFHFLFFLRFYLSLVFLFLDFLLIFTERGREGERQGEKHQCVVASHVPPYWGPDRQHKHVLWLGVEPMALLFASQHSIPWATPARAIFSLSVVQETCHFSGHILMTFHHACFWRY